MLSTVDDEEKQKLAVEFGGEQSSPPNKRGGYKGNTEMWFLTEDGLCEKLVRC